MIPHWRFTIRGMLLLLLIAALGMTVVLQQRQAIKAEQRHLEQVARLELRLKESQQLLESLPVEDPDQVYALATPSYAYARWTWRLHLPKGRRYALFIDVGDVAVDAGSPRVIADSGRQQHIGLEAQGETVLIVEQLHADGRPHLGVSIGQHHTVCRLTPAVAKCLGARLDRQQIQSGDAGVEAFNQDDPIPLLMQWYETPPQDLADGPVGFSVRLEPMPQRRSTVEPQDTNQP